MARILVVAYSRTGTTLKLARRIAQALGADLEVLQDVKSRAGWLGYLRSGYEATKGRSGAIRPVREDPSLYDLVILGTPVWSARPATPMLTYLREHGEAIGQAAFFCTMGGTGAERVFAQMRAALPGEPVATLALTQRAVKANGLGPQIEGFVDTLRRSLAEAPQPGAHA